MAVKLSAATRKSISVYLGDKRAEVQKKGLSAVEILFSVSDDSCDS